MTIFLDGPAEGKRLMLKRAPHFLRVVQDGAGAVDALDQLDDTPTPDETVIAYVMVGAPRSMHVCARGPQARGGWFQGGDYRVAAPQPTDEQLRSTPLWRAWCSKQLGRPIAEDGTLQEDEAAPR